MRVIVTGGAGFIGSYVVDRLVASGCDVYVIDNLSTGSIDNLNKKAEFIQMDINDVKIHKLLDSIRPEVVNHHAAQVNVSASLRDPVEDCLTNILGTVNLLKSCASSGVRKIIYASSAAIYGNPEYLPIDERHPLAPLSFYGLSKLVPEQYIRMFHNWFSIDYTILRYSNVYGPRQNAKGEAGVVAVFTDRVFNGDELVVYGNGEQTRDFIYVEDVAAANLAALEKGSQLTLNVSTNVQTTLNHLLNLLEGVVQKEIKRHYAPARSGDIGQSCLDNRLAKGSLFWQPQTGLHQGIQKMFKCYKGNSSYDHEG